MAYTSTLQKLAENLTATYENTIFSNPGNIGNSRERQVIEYLRRVMPRKYGFQSGEVFDQNDNQSGQIDVIIYDALFSTVFSDGSENILAPVESTYGVISVKSKMGTKELDHAIEGIKRYDALVRTAPTENAVYISPDTPLEGGKAIQFSPHHQKNINCIFAFETLVANKKIIEKIRAADCVDLLIVPGKLLAVGRYRGEFGFSKNNGDKVQATISEHDNAISLFILFLQIYLSRNRLVAREITSLAKWLLGQSKNTVF